MRYILALLFSVIILFNVNAKIPSFMNKNPKEGLWEALEYYKIHHKEIVYAQAILETGWFKSINHHNNLFGLRGKHYYTYKHWSESIKAYKEKIQSRYKQGEDYYQFLIRIRYASNPNYINVLKSIVRSKPWIKKQQTESIIRITQLPLL